MTETTDPAPEPATHSIKRRRILLGGAVAIGLIAVAVFALTQEKDDPQKLSGPPRGTAATPVARINMVRGPKAPKKAIGLAEVVRRDGKPELRLIARYLKPLEEDGVYRIYFSNATREKTLGTTGTDKKGTLLAEAPIDLADLEDFRYLIIARDTPQELRTILVGDLPN